METRPVRVHTTDWCLRIPVGDVAFRGDHPFQCSVRGPRAVATDAEDALDTVRVTDSEYRDAISPSATIVADQVVNGPRGLKIGKMPTRKFRDLKVPLPVDVAPLNVSQVPPPVTLLDVPPLAGPTKVPQPVSLIDRLLGFLAEANATPPAVTVGGVVAALRWMISQRTWSADACITGRPMIMHNPKAKDTTALTRIHFDTILMFVLLAKQRWS
jgi:hypothetical protein